MSRTKREQILETAMRLFVENGIQATPTSLIAKKAGVATGTLFHHFATKEELVNELYHEIFTSMLAYQKERFNRDTDVRERLRQIWHLDIEWGSAHEEYSHFLERYSFWHYASESAINEAHERFETCLSAFKEAVSSGLTKFDDIEYVKSHYIWNVRMNTMYFIAHPEKNTPENIEKSFDIYWQGISNA